MSVSVSCPAKVNLFLRIFAREESGHHQIETFFLAVGLWDRVTVGRGGPGVAVNVGTAPWSAPGLGDLAREVGEPGDSTVARAAEVFFDATGREPSVSIELAKAIPAGTGLGGGSSDAAGTLAALNKLYGRPLGRGALVEIGGWIGADVAFFCAGAPAALAWGRGDRLMPCSPPPPAPTVLVVPRQRFATADAYREASAALDLPAGSARLPVECSSGDWRTLWELADWVGNDFERTAFRRSPALAVFRSALVEAGAAVARLTGSGSALYGVFATDEAARRAVRRIGAMEGVAGALLVSTLDAMPKPEKGA